MKQYKVIAIMGAAGVGKDTILKCVLNLNTELHGIVSHTTRPRRENELYGVDYYYISKENFQTKIENNEMIEYTIFNNWYYGTSFSALKEDKINVGVFNPAGVRALMSNPDIDLIIYHVRAADKVRLLRQLKRETNPNVDEIIRRYHTDKADFSYTNILDIPATILWNDNEQELVYSVQTILNGVKKVQFLTDNFHI
jgi:guanylate kinase